MWFTTSSLESVTRPQLALVAIYATVATATLGYYVYTTTSTTPPTTPETVPGQGLHRSNAVRRSRRSRRSRTQSSASSDIAGDENVENPLVRALEEAEPYIPETDDGFWEEPGELPGPSPQRSGHNIVNLLFRVSEDNARRNGCVHRGCQCNSCGMAPIRGIRYRCVNCADFDLCETCESQGMHTKAHIFYKIRVPVPPFSPRQMQPVWYTGDPDGCRRALPKDLIPRLTALTGFERPELEAFWEQWTFMANTEWRNDPLELCLTMDRKTFERCLVPTGGSRHAAPNLIHDRMFAFYDEDKDGYISFPEFLRGLAYRKQKDKLEKVFQGYDIDGDGLVNRKDFLRMFRAYYVLYKQMHRDILDGLEDQVISSTEAQQLIASRQPLSGLFGREGGISRGDGGFRLHGKSIRMDGNIKVNDGKGPVRESRGDTASRQDILTSLFACEPDPRSLLRTINREAYVDEDYYGETILSEADRPFLVTLLDPPTRLNDLPNAVMGVTSLEIAERTQYQQQQDNAEDDEDEGDEDGDDEDEGDEGDEDDEGEENREDEGEDEEEGDDDNEEGDANDGEDDKEEEEKQEDEEAKERERREARNRENQTYMESLMRQQAYHRQRVTEADKRRRSMARSRLHDRWKRRQFYLDEEEGGRAPEGWNANEDVFPNKRATAKSSRASIKADILPSPYSSAYLRAVGDEWRQGTIPEPERDAGKEILYQVTQQAFNELLDTIFQSSEDIAVKARETRAQRKKHKAAIAALLPKKEQKDKPTQLDPALARDLERMGFSKKSPSRDLYPVDSDEESVSDTPEWYDATMPQFRPDSMSWEELYETDLVMYPITKRTIKREPEPTAAT
jgi:hypothetical protein